MQKIKVGISSCLLGEEVRYNGGHKLSRVCVNELARYFDYLSLCPEVGIGLGVPRKPVRLLGDPEAPRVVGVEDHSVDVTEELQSFADTSLPQLAGISAYIFMKDSPSCGLFKVKVYQQDNPVPFHNGRGVFAGAVTRALPLLPVEEAGRLQDAVLRENFITRVFAYHRWQALERQGLSASALINFHSRYKYTLMAHDPQSYGDLGRMLADAGRQAPEELGARYIAALMEALKKNATRRSNTNVLMHLQGYLKRKLQAQEKQKLGEVIEQYRQGIIPLIVPVTLLQHHFNNHPDEYISRQAFFDPYPADLGLRNSI